MVLHIHIVVILLSIDSVSLLGGYITTWFSIRQSSSSAFIRNPFANALFYCICGNRFILIELICICFFNPRELILNSRMNSTYPNCQRFNHEIIRLVLRLISTAIYFTYDLTYDLFIVGSVYKSLVYICSKNRGK